VGGSPIQFIDPSGLCVWDLCIAETVTVVAIVEFVVIAGISAYAMWAIDDAIYGIDDSLSGIVFNENPCPVDDSEPLPDTKGKTKLWEKGGGWDQANDDFDDKVDPETVKDIETAYGSGRTGKLPDGRKITVRPGSSDGRPTIEVRKPNGRGHEVRYN
jgi:hypothetical protein